MSLPELFGPYLLHHLLAKGASSEVFLAQTTGEFPRLCAIKRILPELAARPDFSEMFRKDAALLVRLIHGNLVQVLEVGSVEEHPFLAMEPIDGMDLPKLIAQVPVQGPLPPEAALFVSLEVCEAITYLHLRREEELQAAAWPLQIMLSFDGVVKIVDLGSFGGLREDEPRTQTPRWHPGHCVPEVIRGGSFDLRAGLFVVGLALWEMLEGRRLVADDGEGYLRGVESGAWSAPLVERKDVSGDVIRLVASLLHIDPQRRPSTVEEVHRRLVEGLRRLAPSYGSAQLSHLLGQRCQPLIGRTRELTEEVIHRARTEPRHAPAVRTRTYGRAGEVQRRIEPPKPLHPGDTIPGTRYRLIRTLGEGGFAEVHAAQHVDLDRQVAIKILSPQLAEDAEAIAQFRQEARACSRIGHPNIVDVIDFGELSDGRFFFAMELLEGKNLAEVLAQEGPLPPGRAVGLFRQIAKALQAAHAHGMVHRDLKPENIMLIEKEGRADFVKVLDFGVMAFASDANPERAGTAGYMAPEQTKGEPPTFAMDIYAAGTVLYEVLSGELPYPADSIEEFIVQQAEHPPPALRSRPRAAEVPLPIERVVHRALERDPKSRHPSMADFEADLIQAAKEAGLSGAWDDLAAPTHLRDQRSLKKEASSSRRPRTLLWIGITLAGLAVVVLIGARLWPTRVAVERPTPSGLAQKPSPGSSAPLDSPEPRPSPPPRIGLTTHDATSPALTERVPVQGKAVVPAPSIKRQLPPLRPTASPASKREEATSARLVASGNRLLSAGTLAQARAEFEQALKLHPDDVQAIIGLAAVFFEEAQYVKTVELARQALSLNGHQVQAHLLLGDALFKLLRRSDAIAAWEKVLSLDPQNHAAARRLEKVRGGGTSRP